MMDECHLEKLYMIMDHLPAEEVEKVFNTFKDRQKISPRVAKLVKIFGGLSEEEQEEFFRNAKPVTDGTND
jgi:hypothetical protein